MNYLQAAALNQAIRAVAIKHRTRATSLLGEIGLHPGQEVILLELHEHGPRTQAQLAHGAGCEPPSVTVMVRKLEAAGLVRRHPSTTDGRAIVVELTAAGRRLIPELQRVWLQLAEESVANLSTTAIPELVAALEDLSDSIRARP